MKQAAKQAKIKEELKGNQDKIDANHNDKIDAQDFKMLRAKKKGMKEELYDHEKENKSVATYGKKPKVQKPGLDPETKEAPQAAAVLSGGKTMTGVPRDTIEIDPMMKTKKQAIFGSQKTIK